MLTRPGVVTRWLNTGSTTTRAVVQVQGLEGAALFLPCVWFVGRASGTNPPGSSQLLLLLSGSPTGHALQGETGQHSQREEGRTGDIFQWLPCALPAATHAVICVQNTLCYQPS